jgi:anti-anti-sigma regulatory factor
LSVGEARIILQPVGGLILVPLQGPVHEDLLADLGETLLGYLQQHGARGVVLDMAGVEVLDEYDFDRLRRVVESASLMGAPVVLAGIRPSVAAGLTMLGVDATWVRSVRTVEQAMVLLR